MIHIRLWFQTCEMKHAKLVAHSAGATLRKAMSAGWCPAFASGWIYTEAKSGKKAWLRRSNKACYMGEVYVKDKNPIYAPNLFEHQKRPVLFDKDSCYWEKKHRIFEPIHEHQPEPTKRIRPTLEVKKKRPI